ncbi:MAG TPA: cytochrome c oxidase assembly protein [Gemmatimonadaceae bacterium]|nr:cytochrome c oxidase assembly protein [Gemmatimonadaceae bacterium]
MMLHSGAPFAPRDLASGWSWEPAIYVPIAVAAALYIRGSLIEWGRAPHARDRILRNALLFSTGWVVLVAALVSPLHRLGGVLFSAHMAQHELLMTIAAPLLVLSRPIMPFLWAMPMGMRRAVGGVFTRGPIAALWDAISQPVVAAGLHGVAIWGWHSPQLYDATLTNEWVHAAQHASFLGTGLLFWWSVIHGRANRPAYGVSVMLVFFTAVHTTILGALLTMSESSWYTAYTPALTTPWGFTPLEDQQLGGLIMWVPATIAYLVAALALFLAWLRQSEVRVLTRENIVRAAVVLVVFLLPACNSPDSAHAASLMVGGDAERGVAAIRKYGCASCHTIPGVRDAKALVGPSLEGIAGRSYVAGVLSNTPEHMIQWIQNPQAVDNKTAMPNVGVTERDARDIATYLYTLK